MSENLIKFKENESPPVTWIKRKISRNQNLLSLMQGPTGSSKSYSNISICLEIDPNFDVNTQIVFSLSGLMDLIESEEFKKKKWKQIIYEEAQVSLSNRNWQSAVNKLINYLLSTFRHQNILLYFNAPFRDFLDSHSLKLLHLVMETRGIDYKEKTATIITKLLQYNSNLRKFFEHSLYLILPNGSVKPFGEWFVNKPPEKICKAYEKRKEEFTSKLNKDIRREARKLEGLTDDTEKSIIDVGTTRQREAKRLYVKHKGDIKEMAKEMKTSWQNTYKLLGGKEGIADIEDYMTKMSGKS